MNDEQFKRLDTQLSGIHGAINVLAEAVAPVESSLYQAIVEMSGNLAKWQASQSQIIEDGFALVAVNTPPHVIKSSRKPS